MTPAAPPRYRIVLVNPRTGRRRVKPHAYSDFYRAAEMAVFYERQGQRNRRRVLAEIVTVRT